MESVPTYDFALPGRQAHATLLLGASPSQLGTEAGLCYPHPHTPVRHTPSRFHFLETDVFRCDSSHRLPLMCAIEGDHVEIVK